MKIIHNQFWLPIDRFEDNLEKCTYTLTTKLWKRLDDQMYDKISPYSSTLYFRLSNQLCLNVNM